MSYEGSISELEELLSAACQAGIDSNLVEIGRRLGADGLHLILSELGGPIGMQTYVPSPENFAAAIRRTLRNHAIRTGYDGTTESISTFSIEFGISKTRVRQILSTQPGRQAGS